MSYGKLSLGRNKFCNFCIDKPYSAKFLALIWPITVVIAVILPIIWVVKVIVRIPYRAIKEWLPRPKPNTVHKGTYRTSIED